MAGRVRLGEYLHYVALISVEQLRQGLSVQAQRGGRIGTNLVELGFVSVNDVAYALALQHRKHRAALSYVENAGPEILALVPRNLCAQYGIFPLVLDTSEGEPGILHLAMHNPWDTRIIEALSKELGFHILPYVIPELRLFLALEKRYGILRPERFSRVRFQDGPADPKRYTTEAIAARKAQMEQRVPRRDVTTETQRSAEVHDEFSNPDISVVKPLPQQPIAISENSQKMTRGSTKERDVQSERVASGEWDDEDPFDVDIDVDEETGGDAREASQNTESLETLLRSLETATHREKINRLITRPIVPATFATVLFYARQEMATAKCAEGIAVPHDTLHQLIVSLAMPSVLQKAYSMKRLQRSRDPDDATLVTICKFLKLPTPTEVFVTPIVLGGRVVTLLVSMTTNKDGFPSEVERAFQTLATKTATAYLRLIRSMSEESAAKSSARQDENAPKDVSSMSSKISSNNTGSDTRPTAEDTQTDASSMDSVAANGESFGEQKRDEGSVAHSEAREGDHPLLRSGAVSSLSAQVLKRAQESANFVRSISQQRPSRLDRKTSELTIALKYARDHEVRAARVGPSPENFEAKIAGSVPSVENLELFYRLGLALVAVGRWTEAKTAFDAIESVQPYYKDTRARADEIKRWQQAVVDNHFGYERDEEGERRYTILGQLGEGGLSVVFRARDERLDRDVALKFLSEAVSRDKAMRVLFEREARAAARMNHPNIVTIYDTGVLGGRAFISMEIVTGITIERLLEQYGRLNVLGALKIANSILSALDFAHSKQIIHRDIKPSNMMLNDLGVVKLMDFGLAKSSEGRANTTMIAGTPRYMAPEQFIGKNVNASSDLFAFGATLYQMLTGRPPFDGMLRDDPPRSIREMNPAVPEVLEAAIFRSLEFDQTQRFQQAKEMLEPIRQILDDPDRFLTTEEQDYASQTMIGYHYEEVEVGETPKPRDEEEN